MTTKVLEYQDFLTTADECKRESCLFQGKKKLKNDVNDVNIMSM
jgi:hypothetical protein